MDAAFQRSLRFLVEDNGVTATEYAIMLGLIVVAVVGTLSSMGRKVEGVFITLDQGVNGASGS